MIQFISYLENELPKCVMYDEAEVHVDELIDKINAAEDLGEYARVYTKEELTKLVIELKLFAQYVEKPINKSVKEIVDGYFTVEQADAE